MFEKSAKKSFLFTLISCPKNGGKKSGKLFLQNHSYNASKQCWEKIVGIKSEKTFLYSHEIRDHKMGVKKSAKQFFQKHSYSASRKCWEKYRRKKVLKKFYTYTIFVTKKLGVKNARNIFSRNTRIVLAKNVGKKIVGKSAKTFFIFTQIS